MKYGEIKYCDIANGNGVRTTLFVSGCRHRCPHCFNPETWSFDFGKEFTPEVWEEIFQSTKDYINGLTLLGGDPCEPENQRALIPFLREYKKRFPQKDVWCYTGFTYEELCGDSRANIEVTREFLELVDILIDGRYVEELKNIGLIFRGSSNQRIIDMNLTRSRGEMTLWVGMSKDRV